MVGGALEEVEALEEMGALEEVEALEEVGALEEVEALEEVGVLELAEELLELAEELLELAEEALELVEEALELVLEGSDAEPPVQGPSQVQVSSLTPYSPIISYGLISRQSATVMSSMPASCRATTVEFSTAFTACSQTSCESVRCFEVDPSAARPL